MIEVSTGSDVDRFLRNVTGSPERFSEVVICSPFVDDITLSRILPLAVTSESGCRFRLITSPISMTRVRAAFQPRLRQRASVAIAPRLHAKIYIATAKRSNDSEAIVTSANLTTAGMASNIELGVRAKPTSDDGRRLFQKVSHFLGRISINKERI